MRSRAEHRSASRGFTLVELMIVVVIVSILATIAVYGVSRYVASSKTGEAVQLIGAIKAAQESFKDETFRYLDVSTTKSLGNYYPSNSKPGQQKVQWGGGSDDVANNWRMLGVQPTTPVLFVYACAAGADDDAVPSPGTDISIGNWPTAQNGAWYVVKAYADLDAGGEHTVFVGTSFTTELFSAHDGE
jgi:type IV pilus assembly protein PilA